ncbi:MAG: hypothetical protein LBQ06_04550 [Frankiaceae bacterium]|nr:hypothetical protein [Frankiaceae bacterium]
MSASSAAARLLAANPTGMAGPVALFVILLLCVASYYLFRSMTRHLKRVPTVFEGEPPAAPEPGSEPGAS